MSDGPRLLTIGEVARLFRVEPSTVRRWAAKGLLTYVMTLGGHRRFLAEEVHRLLALPADPAKKT